MALALAGCGGSSAPEPQPEPAPLVRWQTEQRIDTGTVGSVLAAIDSSDCVIAIGVARATDGNSSTPLAVRLAPGGAAPQSTRLGTPQAATPLFLEAIGGATPTVLWLQNLPTGAALLTSSLDGGVWSSPQILQAQRPHYALIARGGAVSALVLDGSSSRYGLTWRQRGPTGDWSQATELAQAGSALWGQALAADDRGSVVAVWTLPVQDQARLVAARRSAAGQWEPPRVLDDNLPIQAHPALVALGDGRFVALWHAPGPGGRRAVYRSMLDDRGWSARETVLASPSVDASIYQVAAAGGHALALLATYAGGETGLWGVRRDPVRGWQEAQRFATVQSGTAAIGGARAALNARGTAMVVWQQREAGGVRIRYSISDVSDGVWRVAEVDREAIVWSAAVALADDGTGAVVWSGYRDERHRMFIRPFQPIVQ